MNSEGGKPGNVLTVNGNYTGNNGLMTFNATLGGDNSPTDKMNVKGDTQGNTRVRVDNIGGVGAQTVNGIELIEVGGNSAGNFALTTGTVEAGAYVYTLAKGKGNDEKNWYLTSKWDGVTPADTKTAIDKIYPRHFLATAKVLRFPEVQMHEILSDFARMIPAALDNVKTSLPTDFPENVVTAVETNVLRLHGRLSREYGIK
ncbi:autotransporter outer membrane beta-barrel domain-containing protein [Escherichia coli]|nr:autotransporter outer membrane beta-barrel domain-containing protein [Escherichia coli]